MPWSTLRRRTSRTVICVIARWRVGGSLNEPAHSQAQAERVALGTEGRARRQDSFEVPLELTVAIPTFNSMVFLPRVLEALCLQNHPFKLLFADNSSQDGTDAWLRCPDVARYWKRLSFRSIRDWRVLPRVPHGPDRMTNAARMLAVLAASADTELIFHLDHDVVLPPGSIRDIVEEFNTGGGTGGLGVPYSLKTRHVEHGALLVRTDLAREVDYRIDKSCSCTCACVARTMRDRGLELRYWSRGDFARHLKLETRCGRSALRIAR